MKNLIVLAVFAGLITTAGIGCDNKKTSGQAAAGTTTKSSSNSTTVTAETKGNATANGTKP